VDDNRTNRRILEGLLTRWGMMTEIASDGEQALTLYNDAIQADDPFGLILTDMHMPKMDGFDLVTRLKQDSGTSTSTIMMLTSGGQRGDAQRCGELGIAAYLLKPIRQSELRLAIARVLMTRESNGSTQMITKTLLREQQLPDRSLKILLAEDNPVNQKLACRLLEKRNHIVTVVGNGKEALAALQDQAFDLVLMDVQMPEMDGMEATTILREREKDSEKHQPVVAMTALAMNGDRERCLAAGMDGYISKPIRPQQLDEVLQQYLSSPNDSEPSDASATAGSVIDSNDLLDRLDGDRALLAELVDVFRVDYPSSLMAVQNAIESKNGDDLRRSAHSLKGALGNLSATKASVLAAELEQKGKLAQIADAQPLLDQLKIEIVDAVHALEGLCLVTAG
jgi:CheY-like chemotaxis protein